jgi:2-keto-4-pentenoate hydratase/2-oxohepta-3-ene-1,7-dioic acid hydratase in catechol pathway
MQQRSFSLVTYRHREKIRVGLVMDQHLWEINQALKIVDQRIPASSWKPYQVHAMIDLLNEWDKWLPCLRDVANHLVDRAEESQALNDIALLAPVPAPGKMINVGLNFYDHAEEMGMAVPDDFEPNFFWKGDHNCIIGPSQEIRLSSQYVDWEAELAVIISKPAKNITPTEAMNHVAGFTCHNDVTDRSLMMDAEGNVNLLAAKARDTFGPLGPALVPTEQIQDIDNLSIRLLVNGKMMQNTGVSQMIWGPARCISVLSKLFTLQPGDVIGLGTGGGVGWTHGMTLGPGDLPKARERMLQGGGIFLKAGDTVVVDIPGIGRLENKVVS